MDYVTFIIKEIRPLDDLEIVRCVGVKYRNKPFTDSEIKNFVKSGTSNFFVKDWLKNIKKDNEAITKLEVLYHGSDSAEACWIKQQYIIKNGTENIDLVDQTKKKKTYTKGVRSNGDMRRPIIDQKGQIYGGVLEAAENLMLAPSNISKVLHKKLDHICGYRFEYLNK